MSSHELWPMASRSKQAVNYYARFVGAGSSDPTLANDGSSGRGLTATRTGAGTYQIAAVNNQAKAPKLLGCSLTTVGTVVFYTHVTAYDVANNTINVSTFRQSNNAAYDLSTSEELWIIAAKANTVTP